jgi:tetratricopeptide (TPR) repeat protein
VLTQTNQVIHPGERLRTGINSRVGILWSDQSVIRFDSRTEVEILAPHENQALSGLSLISGILSFFHRNEPGKIRILTRGALAGIEGTEFALRVENKEGSEFTTVSVMDGLVVVSNALGSLVLTNQQQAVVELGKAPSRAPGFVVNNVLQWCFYYPAILDVRELPLEEEAQRRLEQSLTAYRSGDLASALQKYSIGDQPSSEAESIYRAALFLSIGQVDKTEKELRGLSSGASAQLKGLAASLYRLIAAVKHQTRTNDETQSLTPNPLATDLLATSYYEQSLVTGQKSLKSALDFARRAATSSPEFGFAWARVAELEFSFGRTAAALDALDKALALAPQNAQAIALKGFLLAAQNKTDQALSMFNRAIAADPSLANAWLGRGLCRIRQGDSVGGHEDLLVAAALEPQRSLLRSYLGKSYTDQGRNELAMNELKRARELDPADPTAWLYSALLKQQQNRVNEAIADLETSQKSNDNRSLFRSRLLLDQDRAVGSANLASIYRDAGMTDVAVREAARAVTYDYANSSAHLFLSDSYNELRDPTRFNLRYETVWFNEFLLANILSPVGGGRLSQNISQQEYSRLFQADGLGAANSTLHRSDNNSVTEYASQFGTFGGTSYSLDLDYQHNGGVRVNNDLDSIEWYTTVKQQITPRDTFMALIKYEDYHSGDNFQYYSPTNVRPNFRFDEYQHPIVVGTWHHEWGPGMHTLLLGGRLENEQQFSDRQVPLGGLEEVNGGTISRVFEIPFDLKYEGKLDIYTGEINQIAQSEWLTLSVGGRYQGGEFDTKANLSNPTGVPPIFFDSTTNSASNEGFQRLTGYGYATLEPLPRLWLTGGFAYDDITFPSNFRQPPLTSGQEHRSQLGPKGALVWEPVPQLTIRGIYAKSLGGVTLDQSYRLEPTQIAGFPQAFRTIISESVIGSVAAPEIEVYGPAVDLKFSSGTYIGLQYQHLNSQVDRDVGFFVLENGTPPYVPATRRQNIDSHEDIFTATVNQLLGKRLSLGAAYKYDRVQLVSSFPSIPATHLSPTDDTADLHELTGYVLYNHPSGFFARADATWYHQGNAHIELNNTLAGDDFVQENVYAGYRLWNRRAELLLGIANLSNEDYHLNPITPYSELPRKRSVIVRLNFVF